MEAFQVLAKEHPQDASLQYNLGCAAYRSEELGVAMVAFLRADNLRPGNADIAHNLNLVRALRTDKIDVLPPRVLEDVNRRTHRFIAPDAAGFAALAAGVVMVILLLAALKTRKRVLFNAAWVVACLLLLFGILGAASRAHETGHRLAVLTEPSAYIKAEPSMQSLDLLVIHEGTELLLLNEDMGWMQVQLTDGRQGWISKEVYEEI